MFKFLRTQPSIGIVALTLGGLVLALSWRDTSDVSRLDFFGFLVWGSLVAATIAAAHFRIHLRNNTKLMVITLPLYLMAVLFPPLLAALGAAVAMLGVSLVIRRETQNYLIDIATTVGRWTVVAWLGSLVAHYPTENALAHLSMIVLAAIVMFFGDLIGTAFEVTGVSGEPVPHLVRVLFRELMLPESVQYLLGVAGALAAQQELVALVLLAVPGAIVYIAFKRAKEMQESTRRLLEGMADTIDLRDPYTGGHSRRVNELCHEILNALPLRGLEADLILSAARVHDIGKISVPDEVLRKPGTLTPEERKLMEAHVEIGAQLLQGYKDFARGKEIVRHHHERWDGGGYPAGLREMEIPLGARVIAVADSFDAMTSDRPYRRAFSTEKAMQILREGRGTQWDARIVDAFLATRTAAVSEPVQTPAISPPAASLGAIS